MHFGVHILYVSRFSWLFIWFCSNSFCLLDLRRNILVFFKLNVRNVCYLRWRFCLALGSRTSLNLPAAGWICLLVPRGFYFRGGQFRISQIGFWLTRTEIFNFLYVANLFWYLIPLMLLSWWLLNLRKILQVYRLNIWHLKRNIVSLIKVASIAIALRLILRSGRKERFFDTLGLMLSRFFWVYLYSQRCGFRGKNTLVVGCNWWTLP